MALDEQLGAIDPADVADTLFRQSVPGLPTGRVDPGAVADRLYRGALGQQRERAKPKAPPTAPDLSKYGEPETDLSKYGDAEPTAAPTTEPEPKAPEPKPSLLDRAKSALKGILPDESRVPRPGLSLGSSGTPPDTGPKPNPDMLPQVLDDVPQAQQAPFRGSALGSLGALSPEEAQAERAKRIAETQEASAAATEQRRRLQEQQKLADAMGSGNIKRGRANYSPNPVPSAIKEEETAEVASKTARDAPLPTMSAGRNAADKFIGSVLDGARSTARGLAELGATGASGAAKIANPKVENAALDRMSGATKNWIADAFPADKSREKDFWTSQVPQGAGSSVPFLVAGLAGKAVGLGDSAITSLIATAGAGQQAGSEVEQFDDAIKKYRSTLDGLLKSKSPADFQEQFSDDKETLRKILGPAEYDRLAGVVADRDPVAMQQAMKQLQAARAGLDSVVLRRMAVLFANAAIGTTEALPISNALERINTLSGGAVARIAKAGAANSFEEFVQEIGQQIGQNAVQRVVYDHAQDIFEGAADAGKVAAVIGLFQGAGIQAFHEAMGASRGAGGAGAMPLPGTPPPMPSTGGPGVGPGPGTGTGPGPGATSHPGFTTFRDSFTGYTFHRDNFTGDSYWEDPSTGEWKSGAPPAEDPTTGAAARGSPEERAQRREKARAEGVAWENAKRERAAEEKRAQRQGTTAEGRRRTKLEALASGFNEHSPEDIASWSDEKLKEYVNVKGGMGMAPDEDILRRAGHTDDEIKGMSPEQRQEAAKEARDFGIHAGEEPPVEGSREAPIAPKTAEETARAADAADADHTPAQGEANNAQRGHMVVLGDEDGKGGLGVTIEAKRGGVRRGVAPNGTPFETTVGAHYGYFKGLPKGADGQAPDVFVGDHPTSPVAFVIDETDPKTGKYRQSKSFVHFQTFDQALNAYLDTSSKNPEHVGGMKAFPVAAFKELAKAGGLSKPVAETSPSEAQESPSGAPNAAGAPVTADHVDAVDEAIRASGTDPATVDHRDIVHAAEIHAREGMPPEEAFLTAVMRGLVEDGHINEQEARDAIGPEAEELLVAGGESQRGAPAQEGSPAARGEASEAKTGVSEGGGEDRGKAGGSEGAGREADGRERKAPAASGAAGGRGTVDEAAGGERAPTARTRGEGAGRGAGEHGREAGREASGAALIGEPVSSLPEHNVTGADNKAVRVRPVVVEASKLITSWNPGYLKALQPRQRDRAASQAQIREIATRLDPERLGYSAEADRGAPIVGPDRMVESGNGRVAALRALYRTKGPNADKYREWLKAQGVDVAKFKEPVLVRQRLTDLEPHERVAFTVAANQSATLSMSAPERALADARHLTPQMLSMIEDAGNLGAAGNRGFVRAFVATIPASERGAVTAAGGALSAEGLTRARNAVLARAYGDADVLARITESNDDEIRSISNALVMAAPQWAKLIADIDAGRVRPDLDATPELMAAVKQTADIRGRGQKLDEYLRQEDAFDKLPGPVETFMRMFYDPAGKRAAGAPRIAEALRYYAEEAAKVSTDPRFDLGTPEVTADEIQRAALAKTQDKLQGAPGAGTRHGAGGAPDRSQARGPESRARGEGASGRERPGPGYGLAEGRDLFGADTGAEGRPQLVFPGAERISTAEIARRRAAAALKPKVAQKAADHGLFGDEGKQTDLVDLARKPSEPRQYSILGKKPIVGPERDENFRRWFKNSAVVKPDGSPLVVYHGATRPDRIAEAKKFDRRRATSGPMSFFTDNAEIASKYATSKPDTSLEDAGYHEWFRIKAPGFRKAVAIDRAWWSLPPDERQRVAALAPRVSRDDQGGIYLEREGWTRGTGGYDQHIKESRGNHLKALVEEWLSSGNLYNDEEAFLKVLDLAGVNTPVEYHNPNAEYPGVLPVYLSIQKPLDTSDIPASVVDALARAANRVRKEPIVGADIWAKQTRRAHEWIETLRGDIADQKNSHAWTSIPDWVTKTLRSLGYDGIKDSGGKKGGQDHTVWIPFDETQVKSVNNLGAFDSTKPQILASLRPANLTPAAQQRRADIERMLTQVVRHLVGKNVRVTFPDTIPVDGKSLEAWGSTGADVQTAAGSYLPAKAVIELAMNDPAHSGIPMSTAFHEAFHAVEHLLFNDKEIALLLRETPRLRKWLSAHPELMQDAKRGWADDLGGIEVRAVAFETYAMRHGNGKPSEGFHTGIARLFGKLLEFLRRLRNALGRLGFKTTEDIFADVYAGRMAGREPVRGPRRDPADVTTPALDAPEKIKSAAVRLGDNIYESADHGSAANDLMAEHGEGALKQAEAGFTTSRGRFVSREEAERIAGIKDNGDLVNAVARGEAGKDTGIPGEGVTTPEPGRSVPAVVAPAPEGAGGVDFMGLHLGPEFKTLEDGAGVIVGMPGEREIMRKTGVGPEIADTLADFASWSAGQSPAEYAAHLRAKAAEAAGTPETARMVSQRADILERLLRGDDIKAIEADVLRAELENARKTLAEAKGDPEREPFWERQVAKYESRAAALPAPDVVAPTPKGEAGRYYIGTQEPFAPGRLSELGAGKNERAIFLSTTEEHARDYGDIVTPVDLRPSNPKVIDWTKREGELADYARDRGLAAWYEQSDMVREIERARADGHDVLIINNIEEPGTRHGMHTQVAVLDQAAIKTAPERAVTPDGKAVERSGQERDQFSVGRKPNTDTAAFKHWFGDSKVVDKDGEPLVVYHGTTASFTAFDPAKLGAATRHPSARLGFFFSASPEVADLWTQSLDDSTWPPKMVPREGGNIVPGYLSIRNPFELSVEKFREINATPYGEQFEREQPEATKRFYGWIDKNKAMIVAKGHDGIHIKGDQKYADRMGGEEYAADAWVAFKPEQIKSATGNRGTFDPSNPSGLAEGKGPFRNLPTMTAERAKAVAAWASDVVYETTEPKNIRHWVASAISGLINHAGQIGDPSAHAAVANAIDDISISLKVTRAQAAETLGKAVAKLILERRKKVTATDDDVLKVLNGLSESTPVFGRSADAGADRFRGAVARALGEVYPQGPLHLVPGKPAGKQAQAFVIERGRLNGDEHLVAIGADGRLIDQNRGDQSRVNFPPSVIAALADPAGDVVLHHNHPFDGTLSDVDISQLGLPGLTSIWAHGHDGTVARASLTPAGRRAMSRFTPSEAVRNLYHLVNSIGDWSFRRPLQQAVSEGRLTNDQGNNAFFHLIHTALDRAGVIDYRSNVDLGSLVADLNLEPRIERAATAVRGRALNGARTERRDNRPAGTLQHPGDVGASFERTAQVAAEHAPAPRDDRDRGTGDRSQEARRTARAGQLRLPGIEEAHGGLAAGASRFTRGPGAAAAGGAGAGTPPPPPPPGGHGGAGAGTAGAGGTAAAQAAVLSRIVPSEKPGRLPRNFNEIYTMAKDDLWPIAVLEKELSGGRRLPVEQSPYKLARLTRGSSGKADQFLKYGTFDFNTLDNNGPSLQAVLKPVENSLDGFRAYAVSRRTLEKEAQGIKTGVPLAAAQQVVTAGAARYAPTFVALRAYQDRVIDYMQKSGLLSADGVAAMRQVNHDYVPFYRAMGADKEFGRQLGGGLKTRDPIKKMKGSERQIIDPIESIVKDTHLFIALAERNRALQALEDLASGSTVGNLFMERVKTKMAPIKVSPEEINRHLRGEGINEEVSDTMTIFRPQPFRPQPDEIAIWRDGKRRVYKVGKDVAEAVNALDRDALNIVTRMLAVPAKMLRAGAVLAPEFIARNPVRDQFSAVAFSESGYRPIVDLVHGLRHLFKKDSVFQDWLKGGGAGAAMVALDRDYISNNVIRLTKPTWARRGWHVIKSPLEALRVLSETFENASRLGEMHRARDAGKSRMTGAFDSRELTLDFARMGAQTKSINAVIPFFNAQGEGVDRAARAFHKNPLRTLFKVMLSITLPSILLWLVNHDDDRYKELPAWEKDYFWHIITDNWVNITSAEAAKVPNSSKRQVGGQWMQNKGTIWKIPKPFELGVLFGSVPERVLDAFFTDNPHAFRGLADSIKKALLPNWMPQVAIPVVEQFSNRSTFTDRTLVPKYLEGVLPKYQAQPFTSETAQILGNLISKINEDTWFSSPIVIDNYIRQWTGGLGAHAISIVDKGLEAAGLTKDKIKPSPTLADLPVIKGFVSRYPSANSQSVQEFYDTYEHRKRAADTIKYLQKTGEKETAAQERDNRAINTAENMHKAMSNQFKFIRGVYLDKKMTPSEKRQIIDATYLQVIEIAKRGNELFKKTEKTPRERREESARQPAL